MAYALLLTMRPRQWTKNLLLFAGVLFSNNFLRPEMTLRALAGAILYCLLSGVVYIFNDVADMESDQSHPDKRTRPIASGRLAPQTAMVAGVVLAGASLAGAFWINLPFGACATLYFVLMLAYSFFLKHVVILDLMILALGFVLRAVAGVLAIRGLGEAVPMTPWFLACTLFLALFLAICKRRNELLTLDGAAESHRRVLSEYSPAFLDQMVSVSTAATVISYAIYTTSAGAIGAGPGQGSPMIYTLPFVIYGVFRYLYQVYHMRRGGAPEAILLFDRWMIVNIVLWLAAVVYILARHH